MTPEAEILLAEFNQELKDLHEIIFMLEEQERLGRDRRDGEVVRGCTAAIAELKKTINDIAGRKHWLTNETTEKREQFWNRLTGGPI